LQLNWGKKLKLETHILAFGLALYIGLMSFISLIRRKVCFCNADSEFRQCCAIFSTLLLAHFRIIVVSPAEQLPLPLYLQLSYVVCVVVLAVGALTSWTALRLFATSGVASSVCRPKSVFMAYVFSTGSVYVILYYPSFNLFHGSTSGSGTAVQPPSSCGQDKMPLVWWFLTCVVLLINNELARAMESVVCTTPNGYLYNDDGISTEALLSSLLCVIALLPMLIVIAMIAFVSQVIPHIAPAALLNGWCPPIANEDTTVLMIIMTAALFVTALFHSICIGNKHGWIDEDEEMHGACGSVLPTSCTELQSLTKAHHTPPPPLSGAFDLFNADVRLSPVRLRRAINSDSHLDMDGRHAAVDSIQACLDPGRARFQQDLVAIRTIPEYGASVLFQLLSINEGSLLQLLPFMQHSAKYVNSFRELYNTTREGLLEQGVVLPAFGHMTELENQETLLGVELDHRTMFNILQEPANIWLNLCSRLNDDEFNAIFTTDHSSSSPPPVTVTCTLQHVRQSTRQAKQRLSAERSRRNQSSSSLHQIKQFSNASFAATFQQEDELFNVTEPPGTTTNSAELLFTTSSDRIESTPSTPVADIGA
jgi:hypothetical protein